MFGLQAAKAIFDTTSRRDKYWFRFRPYPSISHIIDGNQEFDSEKKGKKKKKRSSRKNKARADGHFPVSNESSLVSPGVTVNSLKLEDAKNLFSHYADGEDAEDEEYENQFELSKKLGIRNKNREKLERAKEYIKNGHLHSKDGSIYDDPVLSQLVKTPSSTKSESYIDQIRANRSKERRRSSGVSFSDAQTADVPSWQEESNLPSRHSTRHNSNSSHSVSFYDQSISSYPTHSSQDSQDSGTEEQVVLTSMLHQIQSDIAVKEQLVLQLERAGNEYVYMKDQYEQKLIEIQEALVNLQHERDAVKRAQNSRTGVSIRDKNSSLAELKARYEHRVKRFIQEIDELRRRYNEAIQSNANSKYQNVIKLRSMRVQIEQLKKEKLRMIKLIKEDAKRIRVMTECKQREIQNLLHREKVVQEQKRRLEIISEMQKLMLEKRNKEVLQSNQRFRTVMALLKQTTTPKLIAKALRNHKQSPDDATHEGIHTSCYDKKKLLDEAIYKYISCRSSSMMDEWINKRNKLQDVKKGLLEKRKKVITGEFGNELFGEVQALDDKIEMIDSEITNVNAKIRALQSENRSGSHEQVLVNRSKERRRPSSRLSNVSFGEIQTIELPILEEQENCSFGQNRPISRCSTKGSQNTTGSDEQDNTGSGEYFSGRQSIDMMDEWIDKQDEKKELLEEREKVITSEFGNKLDGEAQALNDKIKMLCYLIISGMNQAS